MTKKDIIEKLAKMYLGIYKSYENTYLNDDKEEAQINLLDDIFDEIFNIKDLYVSDDCLMSFGRKIG